MEFDSLPTADQAKKVIVQKRVRELSGIQAEIFRKWIQNDGADLDRVERLLGEYRSLPPAARAEVKEVVLGED